MCLCSGTVCGFVKTVKNLVKSLVSRSRKPQMTHAGRGWFLSDLAFESHRRAHLPLESSSRAMAIADDQQPEHLQLPAAIVAVGGAPGPSNIQPQDDSNDDVRTFRPFGQPRSEPSMTLTTVYPTYLVSGCRV